MFFVSENIVGCLDFVGVKKGIEIGKIQLLVYGLMEFVFFYCYCFCQLMNGKFFF